MPHPIAYLSFGGNCRQAMQFYEQVLGGELEVMMTFGESPVAEQCSPGSKDRMMHARLNLPGGGVLMAGDCPEQMPYEGIKGVMLTLNYDTTAEAQKVFTALSSGGQVTMPLQPTFWAKIWGMGIDKFGTPWAVNGELLPL